MDLTTADDVADVVKIQLSSLATLISEDGYVLVCDQAAQELGWSYPVTVPTKALWMIKRATRHAINILRIASAKGFKFKQVNLQHRFEHYHKLLEEMDKEFEEAVNGDLALFAGVDSFRMFGTKIDAGFTYNSFGLDMTYDVSALVNFSPKEDD